MVYRSKSQILLSIKKNVYKGTMDILQLDNFTVAEGYKGKNSDDHFRCFFDHDIMRTNLPVPADVEEKAVDEERVDYMNILNELGVSSPVWQHDEFDYEKFNEGYFGKIFKATHRPSNIIYILKVLKDESEKDPGEIDSGTSVLTGSSEVTGEYKEMFFEEIKLLSKLNHPNILKFCGVTFMGQQICYLSEYVDGGTLQELIRYHKSMNVSWNDYLHIMLDIAKGMAYLHYLNIIHRDLNSKNIVLKVLDGKIRYQAIIIDFGLSYQKPDVSTPEEEVPVGPVGSPFHIAPELFRDVPCSTQTDVFSYGIILCEVISGCPGADPDDVPRTNDFGLNVEEFSEMASDCPAELLNLAVRCCQMKSTLRPKFIDIVKIIDIILDIYVELDDEIFENFSDSLNLETSMLCSCMARRKRLLYKKNSNLKFSLPDEILDCERRFVITENVPETEGLSADSLLLYGENKPIDYNGNFTEKRKETENTVKKRRKSKPLLKNRCSLCGGRILQRSEDNIDSTTNLSLDKINTDEKRNIDIKENSKENIISTNALTNSSIDEINNGADVRKSPVITPTKTIPIQVTLPSPEHKKQQFTPPNSLNEKHSIEPSPNYSSLERSVKYPAGAFLKSNRHSLSNKTTQMASNTPGVLPRFFHQILRKRKSRILFHPNHTSLDHTPNRKILPAFLRKTFSHGSLVKLERVNTAEEESFERRTLTYSHSNDKTFQKTRRGSMPFHKGGFSMPGSPTRAESPEVSMFAFSCEHIAESENTENNLDFLKGKHPSKERHKRSRSLLNMFFKRKASN